MVFSKRVPVFCAYGTTPRVVRLSECEKRRPHEHAEILDARAHDLTCLILVRVLHIAKHDVCVS